MAPRACHTAVRMATGDVFSESEIQDLLDRMDSKARRLGREQPTLSQKAALAEAARQLTVEELHGVLVEKRLKVAAEIAQAARRRRLDAMPGSMDPAARIRAYDIGSEKQGRFTSSSTDAEGRARAMTLWGKVDMGLRQVPGLINRISDFWGRAEKDVDRKIAREMARINGAGEVEPTGDEGALHAARVLAQALEQARTDQNAMGAWIDRLPGYIARQSHDRLKVAGGFWRELKVIAERTPREGLKGVDWAAARRQAAGRAFRNWRDFIAPRLDPKTFAGLELEDIPLSDMMDDADERRALSRMHAIEDAKQLAAAGVIDDPESLPERFLYRVWFDIVSGRHEQLSGADDLGDFRPPASKARSVSKARVLHFKDPDAWVDYNQRYGTGSLFHTVMGQLERGARNAALMERWGPSPDAARQGELDRLASQARARGDPDAAKALDGWKVRAAFDAVNGRLNVPESLRMAMVVRNIRAFEAITKLGSIVLSKATDLPMTGHTFARAGAGFLAGYEGALKGITGLQDEAARRAADLLDVGARSFAGHLGGQFSPNDGLTGWHAWAARTMYRLNLFQFVNEGVRRGAAEMLARHLGQEAEHGWDGLQAGTRESFERFGIDERAWELARRGIEPAEDGRKYFDLQNLQRISDAEALDWRGVAGKAATPEAAARARGELELRFRTLIHNVLDDTTSEPRMREQTGVIGSGGLRAGTIWGEAARSFGQFRGFLQTILGRHLAPILDGGYAGMAPAALMAHFIVASALAGWLSMNAKLIVSGRTPRSMLGADPAETAKIWAAALAQGGGLGIYGDYLFGEQNRQGLEFSIGAFGGPAIGDMEQVAQIVRQAIHGGAVSETTGRSQIPGEMVRLGAHNIPLVNLWYTRLALDYLVLWRLQEAVSPGYLQRYEQNAQREGSGFYVPPTSAQQ